MENPRSRAVLASLALLAALVPMLASSKPPTALPAGAENTSEWKFYGNGYDAQFYSPLTQVNDRNVQKLGLAWYADIPAKDALVGNALVADGVVYQSGALNFVYANDVRTGKLLWSFDPHYEYKNGTMATYIGARINRGLALYEGKVIIATGDCRLIAIDRKSGAKAWETISCDKTNELRMQTGAPHVGGGLIFMGNSCLDSGTTRGYVAAYDPATGKRKWLWYTVPDEPSRGYENKAMEMAAKTWGTKWWEKTRGCGQVWEVMTYDHKLDMLYVGVAGVAPFSPAERAPDAGDELFTNSIVALKASTGEYVWHYKLTPHDAWNLEPMPMMVADLPIKGKTERVVLEAAKNGFFYVLDAKTGRFIAANNFAPVNWTKGIDQKTGRPIPNLGESDWWSKPEGATVYGAIQGVKNWNPMAFNPGTGLAYIPIQVMPEHLTWDPGEKMGGTLWDITKVDTKKWIREGRLTGWDPIANKARWVVSQPLTANGGVMTTAGNLVFQGTGLGRIEARAADTGELLWSADSGGVAVAAPTTIEVDGEQVILVPTGNGGSSATARFMPQFAACDECQREPTRLLAFKLGGTAQLPPPPAAVPLPRPARPPYPEAQARHGSDLFKREACEVCHGLELLAINGSVPDLRRASAATHDMFPKIVHEGLFKDLGMPQFDWLTDDEVVALQAYVVNQSWKYYNRQEMARSLATPD